MLLLLVVFVVCKTHVVNVTYSVTLIILQSNIKINKSDVSDDRRNNIKNWSYCSQYSQMEQRFVLEMQQVEDLHPPPVLTCDTRIVAEDDPCHLGSCHKLLS